MSNWRLTGTPKFCAIGADATGSKGVTVTAAATAHTKGSWAQLEASTDFNIEGFWIRISTFDYDEDMMIDIGIGASGSESVLVPNIFKRAGVGVSAFFPVPIKAGTRVSARVQATTASKVAQVMLLGIGSSITGNPGCGRVWDIGNTTTTSCIEVDAGSTANTKGSWVELKSSTPNLVTGLVLSINSSSSGTDDASFLIDIGIGSSGSEKVLIPDIYTYSKDFLPVSRPGYIYLDVDIPAGTRIVARAQCSLTDTSMRKARVLIWGVG